LPTASASSLSGVACAELITPTSAKAIAANTAALEYRRRRRFLTDQGDIG